jgi:5-aminopentanamidase
VLLPELVTSGYVFESAEEARALAQPADRPALADWAQEAARAGAVIVGGFTELGEDGAVYNFAAVVGPAGFWPSIGRRISGTGRSSVSSRAPSPHPWWRLPLVGSASRSVTTTTSRSSRAGLHSRRPISSRFRRTCRSFRGPEGERPVEIALAQATAHVSKVWVAVCDRTGLERGVEWTGASCIVDPDGWLAAGPVDGYGEGILRADCDLALAREKAWGERNDVQKDLRPELYASPRPASAPSRIASSSERGASRSPASRAP